MAVSFRTSDPSASWDSGALLGLFLILVNSHDRSLFSPCVWQCGALTGVECVRVFFSPVTIFGWAARTVVC